MRYISEKTRNKDLINRAKLMRKSATKEENHLWYDYLRKYTLRFYRQKIIGNYIIDFYCDKARLAVEVDGSQHYLSKAKDYDNIRTVFLNKLSIEVIRITNNDIQEDFERVCIIIDKKVKERISNLVPTPLKLS